jgi:hypothetical protein
MAGRTAYRMGVCEGDCGIGYAQMLAECGGHGKPARWLCSDCSTGPLTLSLPAPAATGGVKGGVRLAPFPVLVAVVAAAALSFEAGVWVGQNNAAKAPHGKVKLVGDHYIETVVVPVRVPVPSPTPKE